MERWGWLGGAGVTMGCGVGVTCKEIEIVMFEIA